MNKNKSCKSEKADMFSFLYPFIEKILRITGIEDKIKLSADKAEQLSLLEAGESTDTVTQRHIYKTIAEIMAVVIIFMVFILLYMLVPAEDTNSLAGNVINRPEPGEGSINQSLNITMGEETELIDFTISEREMSQSELLETIDYARQYLDEVMSGENEGLSDVRKNLNFPAKIPGTPIEVEYMTDNTDIISRIGKVNNSIVSEEGVLVSIDATMKYKDRKFIYRMYAHVYPPIYSEWQIFIQKLEEVLEKLDRDTIGSNQFVLPKELDDSELEWSEIPDNIAAKLILLMLVAVCGIKYAADYTIKKKLKIRADELMTDYPELINKLILLMNAGMPVKSAFVRISGEYARRLGSSKVQKRYLYEELLRMCNEMDNGIPEAHAYESFGRRCGTTAYLRLSTMIIQNLRKGNSELVRLLGMEAAEAYKERKEAIKRKGEEAGTKMLMPMAGMLVIVFIIIIVPAFMSM